MAEALRREPRLRRKGFGENAKLRRSNFYPASPRFFSREQELGAPASQAAITRPAPPLPCPERGLPALEGSATYKAPRNSRRSLRGSSRQPQPRGPAPSRDRDLGGVSNVPTFLTIGSHSRSGSLFFASAHELFVRRKRRPGACFCAAFVATREGAGSGGNGHRFSWPRRARRAVFRGPARGKQERPWWRGTCKRCVQSTDQFFCRVDFCIAKNVVPCFSFPHDERNGVIIV
jgi:hypothetical protein